MALTVTLNQPEKIQIQGSPYGTVNVLQVATLNADNSYPANGYAITASQFGLNGILGFVQIAQSKATPTTWIYDANVSTMRVYVGTTTATAAIEFTTTLTGLVEVNVGSALLNNVSPTFLVIGF